MERGPDSILVPEPAEEGQCFYYATCAGAASESLRITKQHHVHARLQQWPSWWMDARHAGGMVAQHTARPLSARPPRTRPRINARDPNTRLRCNIMHGGHHPASKPADRGDKTMLQQPRRQCRDGCALCRKIGCAFAEPCRQADAALSVIVVGEEAMFVTAISVSLCHRMKVPRVPTLLC